jgi:LuxR family maltose regulon positive regulatory protein
MFAEIVYANDKEVGLRYHKLFQDFLESKFRQTLDPAEQRALFLTVGRFYEKRGDLESATTYFLKAEAYPEAIDAIEKVGQSLLNSGRASDLLRWIEQFPQKQIKNNPWIHLYHAICRRFTATADNVKRLLKAKKLFKSQNDVRGRILTLALLFETCILTGRDVIPLMELINEGEALLQSINTDAYLMEKAALWGQVGWAYVLRAGNFKKCINACRQAYLLAKKMGIFALQIYAQAGELMAQSICGDLNAAEKIIKNTEQDLNQFQNQEINTFFNISKI